MSTTTPLDPWLLALLACPYDHTPLKPVDGRLRCDREHSFEVVDGVPIMLRDDEPRTHSAIEKTLSEVRENRVDELRSAIQGDAIDSVVQAVVAATCGRLYSPVVGKLTRYPIPRSRLAPGSGRTLLDIGCNWGRWTLSAARTGYRAIGLDPDLGPILAAKRVATQLGLEAHFVVGSARSLPFRTASLNSVFSYSVIQHFSKEDARATFREAGRVLEIDGTVSIQMPNSHSILGIRRQLTNPNPKGFDVRNWSPRELLEAAERLVGPASLSIDGFFGLGVQIDDLDLMPARYRVIIRSSEALRNLARRLPALTAVADSLYVHAVKVG